MKANGMAELWKSVVRFPCGALNLFNYPESLRSIVPDNPDSSDLTKLDPIDLAAVDIYRDRERGVQRYNDFREWCEPRTLDSRAWKLLGCNMLKSFHNCFHFCCYRTVSILTRQ